MKQKKNLWAIDKINKTARYKKKKIELHLMQLERK